MAVSRWLQAGQLEAVVCGRREVRVLELGTGVGLLGVYLAKALEMLEVQAEVVLSDMERSVSVADRSRWSRRRGTSSATRWQPLSPT